MDGLLEALQEYFYTKGQTLTRDETNAIFTAAMAGYTGFRGIADPANNPGVPTEAVFYIANAAGVYTNFGGVTVSDLDGAGKPIALTVISYNPTIPGWTASPMPLRLALSSIDDLLPNIDFPNKFNVFETTSPIANGINNNAVPISNMPYSQGDGITIPVGGSSGSTFVFVINGWKNDTYLLVGRALRFEFVLVADIPFDKSYLTGYCQTVHHTGGSSTSGTTKVIQLTDRTIKFIFDYTVQAGDDHWNLYYQFTTGYHNTVATINLKSSSAIAYVADEGAGQGYTFNKKVIDIINAQLKPLGKLTETFLPYLVTVGDSQTEGVNNGDHTVYSYIESAPSAAFTGANAYYHLTPAKRWANLLSTSHGKQLTLLNLGVGGSRISWSGGSGSPGFNDEMSHFNMLGVVSPEWQGLAATMMGWNNNINSITVEADKAAFYEVFKTASLAVIARLLVDNYSGIAYIGWDRTQNTGGNSWFSNGQNGSNNSYYSRNDLFNPFPTLANPTGPRYFTRLLYNQYVQFQLNNKRAIAIFYETGNDAAGIGASVSGTFDVLVNGVVYGSYSTNYTWSVNPADFFPGVVWLENVPASAVIKVINTLPNGGGPPTVVRFLAYGWVDRDSSTINTHKMIMVGSTSGNNANAHQPEQIQRFRKAASDAVACFHEYPNVVFADICKSWKGYTDMQVDDVAHITDMGNQHIADAFVNNLSKPDYGSSNNYIKGF